MSAIGSMAVIGASRWLEAMIPAGRTSKTVAAVTLPSLGSVVGYNAALHVFAMSIG